MLNNSKSQSKVDDDWGYLYFRKPPYTFWWMVISLLGIFLYQTCSDSRYGMKHW